jgi:hypothetical protein
MNGLRWKQDSMNGCAGDRWTLSWDLLYDGQLVAVVPMNQAGAGRFYWYTCDQRRILFDHPELDIPLRNGTPGECSSLEQAKREAVAFVTPYLERSLQHES